MQIFIDAKGNANIVTPQHIYQGSNISQINVISLAFTPQTTLQIAFVLPDGTTTNYYPMSFLYSSTVNYYQYIIQQAFTALSGQASIALLATDLQTQQQTSQLIPFTIEPSVLPTLPDTPSQSEWTTLLQYVQQNSSNIANLQTIISDIESIANTANTNASQAVETAIQALSTAQQAEQTANKLANSIAQANSTASQANKTANDAKTTAEQALKQVVEKQGTVAYVGGTYVPTLDFTSDPQTQINNITSGDSDVKVTKSSDITAQMNGVYVQIATNIDSDFPFNVNGLQGNSAPLSKFDFDIIPSGGGANVIQKCNNTNITQIIIDGTSLIFYIESGTTSASQILVNYSFSNGSLTPNLSVIAEYLPSESATVFNCTSTGFESEIISASNINTNSINGQPIGTLGGGITLVENIPALTLEEYNKHLLYLYGGNLGYISEVPTSSPTISTTDILPSPNTQSCSATVGDNIYIFGGGSGGSYYDTILQLNTTTNLLALQPVTLPFPAGDATACSVGTKIYIFSIYNGYTGNVSKVILQFDSTARTITTLATQMPTACQAASSMTVGAYIYIFGGYTGGRLNTILQFDSITQTITTLSATLPNGRSGMAGAAVGNKCYCFGGYKGQYLNEIVEFDTLSQTVTTLSTILPVAKNRICAVTIDTNCYIFGGETGPSSYSNAILKFDSITQTVTTLSTSLPNEIASASAAVVGNNAYVIGGNNSNTLTSIVKVSFDIQYIYNTLQKQ